MERWDISWGESRVIDWDPNAPLPKRSLASRVRERLKSNWWAAMHDLADEIEWAARRVERLSDWLYSHADRVRPF